MSRALSGVSVVVPVYDEEDNIRPLAGELAAALAALEVPWEVIFVDDGSRDGTRKRVLEVVEAHDGFRLVPLDHNQGQSAALVAGVRAARHSHVATLDGDLQNDPNDVPRVVASSRTQPPCASTSRRQMYRPRPLPCTWDSRTARPR